MRSNYKKLGEFIRPVDERNSDLAITNLQGVSITKEFVPSIANIIGTDLSTYKIVRKGQFAYGPVTSRNGDKVSIALLKGKDCIISSSYSPFEVYKPDKLLPEYLMLWFMRPEFDRYARFMSNGSAREVFDWDCMCGVELPVPTLAEQKEIVRAYQVITDRIRLLQEMNEVLEEQAMTVFNSWFVDYDRFACDENGIPLNWHHYTLADVMTTTTNSVDPQKLKTAMVWHYSIPAFDAEHLPVQDEPINILSNKYLVADNSILVSKLNPDTKRIWITDRVFKNAICSTEFIIYIPNHKNHRAFYYLLFNTKHFIDFLVSNATGSTNSRMRVKPLSTLGYSFWAPDSAIIDEFCTIIEPFLHRIHQNYMEIRKLKQLFPVATVAMMIR